MITENSVIVTVIYFVGADQREQDFELPYDIPVGPLSVEFFSFLDENGLLSFSNKYYYFYCEKRRLQSDKTLRENQIYDGNILTVAP